MGRVCLKEFGTLFMLFYFRLSYYCKFNLNVFFQAISKWDNGLHTNGYALVRLLLDKIDGLTASAKTLETGFDTYY